MVKTGKKSSNMAASINSYIDKGPVSGYKVNKVKISGTGKTSKKFNIYKKGKSYGGQ